jgi:hypothetical protein
MDGRKKKKGKKHSLISTWRTGRRYITPGGKGATTPQMVQEKKKEK